MCTFGVDVFVLQPPVSLSELEIGINQWASPPEEAGIYKRMKKRRERERRVVDYILLLNFSLSFLFSSIFPNWSRSFVRSFFVVFIYFINSHLCPPTAYAATTPPKTAGRKPSRSLLRTFKKQFLFLARSRKLFLNHSLIVYK